MAVKVILHIDDDADDCELFHDALKAVSDAKYHEVHDAAQALSMLLDRSIAPDLIFLDLNMPRMDGREVLQALQADPALNTIPVIIFSTSDVHELMHQTRGFKVCDYLTKPTDYTAFREVLRQKLEDCAPADMGDGPLTGAQRRD